MTESTSLSPSIKDIGIEINSIDQEIYTLHLQMQSLSRKRNELSFGLCYKMEVEAPLALSTAIKLNEDLAMIVPIGWAHGSDIDRVTFYSITQVEQLEKVTNK